ncbi:MAG: metal-dependent hydrolase family protein [Candidatus Helarchaeota archaeon]
MIPGLINAHAHLTGDGKPRKISKKSDRSLKRLLWIARRRLGKQIIKSMMRKNIKNALNAGVTTIRSLGDPYYYDLEVRDAIEKNKFIGPRLLVAGKGLCITGGHGWLMSHVVDSPWEARKAIRENISKGVDVIKLISTGGVMDSKKIGEAGRPQMTVDEIEAACNEAHRAGLKVAAHAESTQGVKEALLGGVDTIEHGAELDDECIKLFKDNPKALLGYSALIPTLSAPINICQWGTEELKITEIQRQNAILIKDGLINGFKRAIKEGIKIGVGTDATVTFVTHYDFWNELVFMSKIGNLNPKLVIHLATQGNAEILGISEITGTLELGKSADFIVLEGNPLNDLNYLSKPLMIVIKGNLILNPKVKKIKKIERLKKKKENHN